MSDFRVVVRSGFPCKTVKITGTIPGIKKCVVPSCKNDFRCPATPLYSKHRFPSVEQGNLRTVWIKAIGAKDRAILSRKVDFESARICSDHFTADCFKQTEDGERVLVETVIPTLFGAEAVENGKRNASPLLEVPPKRTSKSTKTKKRVKTAQQPTRKLAKSALNCAKSVDASEGKATSSKTMFRLNKFPNVCRMCLRPPKAREVMIPLDATHSDFDGDSIKEFIFEILPAGVILDQDDQHLLPKTVCLPCLELLKFFARYRTKVVTVHLLMNSLVELKHFNPRPIRNLFDKKADLVRSVIQDLGLCRLNHYTVQDLVDEFPLYDLPSFEGFDIKKEVEEEVPVDEEVQDDQMNVEELIMDLTAELPVKSEAIYADECTVEELTELAKVGDPEDVLVAPEVPASEPPPVVKPVKPPSKRVYLFDIDKRPPTKKQKKYGGKLVDKLMQCPKCDYATHYTYSFKSHLEVHEERENRTYPCKHFGCSEVFKVHADFARHMAQHESFFCDICGVTLSSNSAGRDHMARHAKEYKHQCPYCDQQRITKAEMTYHIQRVHMNNTQHTCQTCGITLSSKNTLDDHMRRHGDVFDFPCTQCDKKFKTKTALKKHVAIVHQKIRMPCTYCDQHFDSTYKLNNHIETTHGIQTRFVCDICVVTCLSQEKLDAHRDQHLNPREGQCGTCLVVFVDGKQLEDHLCITYRDDYDCCGRDHRYHYMYNKHMLLKHGLKTNARVKPIPGQLMGQLRAQRKRVETCPKCEQVFATRTLKKQHMDICVGSDDAEGQMAVDGLMSTV